METESKEVLVLYDSSKKKYLGKQVEEGKLPGLVNEVKDAWQFPVENHKLAWDVAYKLAWDDVGKFFVYVEKITLL